MTCLPMGTKKQCKRTEEWDDPFSKNVTDEHNCHNSFSTVYSIRYECEKKDSLFDFNDHQLDSQFRTSRARPMLEAFKNGYRVAFLSQRHSSFAFEIMSALTSPWYICKIFATLATYLNIFKAPNLIIQVWNWTSSFPEFFLAMWVNSITATVELLPCKGTVQSEMKS